MEVRNRRCRSNSASPAPVRRLFATHPYDELGYDYYESATQTEHRVALTFALSAWIRNGVGAAERLAEVAAILEHEHCTMDENNVAQYALDVCVRVLQEGFVPVATADVVAAGFVTEERFVDPDVADDGGVTVRDLWDWSPFDPLREAEPLADEDDEDEQAVSVLDREVSLTGPLWVWLAGVAVVVTYCWLVAMHVSRPQRHQ
jgi:hypothetical protein